MTKNSTNYRPIDWMDDFMAWLKIEKAVCKAKLDAIERTMKKLDKDLIKYDRD